MSKRRVLFLCTGNSARSQMAEGLVNRLLGNVWKAHSAGTKPSGYVHPMGVRAMSEIDIDIGDHRSKSVDEYRDVNFDAVITLCGGAAKTCPAWLGRGRQAHVGFPDPAAARGSQAKQMAVFRQVRDGIRDRVFGYLEGLNDEDRPEGGVSSAKLKL